MSGSVSTSEGDQLGTLSAAHHSDLFFFPSPPPPDFFWGWFIWSLFLLALPVATLGLCCGVTAAVCQAPWLMFYTTKLPPRCLLGGDSGFLCAESWIPRHAELKFTAVTLSSHKTTWSVGQLAVFPALPTCFHTVRGLLCFVSSCRTLYKWHS